MRLRCKQLVQVLAGAHRESQDWGTTIWNTCYTKNSWHLLICSSRPGTVFVSRGSVIPQYNSRRMVLAFGIKKLRLRVKGLA